jgi:hypothetical protein
MSMIRLTIEEAKVKQHNAWYCKSCRKYIYIAYAYFWDQEDYEIPYCPICDSYDVLEKPERETPEEFKGRTGREWADGSGVYMKIGKNDFRLKTYREVKFDTACCDMDGVPYVILCANSDAGIPGSTEYVVLENKLQESDRKEKAED